MKKISLLLLMGILCFNIINFSVNAQSANTANDNYCSLLEQLGIMSVSSEDTYVTIPEFLQMVFHLTNYNVTDNIMDTAVQLGYITTKKQTELTLVDAVEIMIRVMGRQPSVSESIPYPYNY